MHKNVPEMNNKPFYISSQSEIYLMNNNIMCQLYFQNFRKLKTNRSSFILSILYTATIAVLKIRCRKDNFYMLTNIRVSNADVAQTCGMTCQLRDHFDPARKLKGLGRPI